MLIDYDVCSNWGNWHALAGLQGGRINRFNTLKQSKDYDADGSYVRYWLPELKDVPQQYVHEPHKMPPDVQKEAKCRIGDSAGDDYPRPLRTEAFAGQQHGNSHDSHNKRGRGSSGGRHNRGRGGRGGSQRIQH